jgi:ankyrin repeat protein
MSDDGMRELTALIIAGDETNTRAMLQRNPGLATVRAEIAATRQTARDHFLGEIGHYVYAGDTLTHIASAAYQAAIVRSLVVFGADTNAQNRRGARPLHYAADAVPGGPRWNPAAQRETVIALIELGADPNAVDRNGTAPLHRAVRNRCSTVVSALLEGGGDPNRPNTSGSTPLQLAKLTTGRGGSGSVAAKAEQKEIVRLLQQAKV